MPQISIKTTSGDISTFRKLVSDCITSERKKIEYMLEISHHKLKEFEDSYRMSSDTFIQRFQKNEIEENGDTFEWWTEFKMAKELEQHLQMVNAIEIC